MIRVAVSVRKYNYQDLKRELTQKDRIAVLSCDSCARLNDGLGGDMGAENLVKKLMIDGFDVIHKQLLDSACSPAKNTIDALFQEADVIIPLACQAGVDRTAKHLKKLKILRVTETLGFGTYSPETGVMLTEPEDAISFEIEGEDGIPVSEAAERLGLYSGSF